MGIISELIRSYRKTKAMNNAIKSVLIGSDKELSRKRLYDFLSKDYILSSLYKELSFEQFSNGINLLRASGLTISPYHDYIPIATFCFYEPLFYYMEYKKETYSYYEFFTLIYKYFYSNDAKEYFYSLTNRDVF